MHSSALLLSVVPFVAANLPFQKVFDAKPALKDAEPLISPTTHRAAIAASIVSQLNQGHTPVASASTTLVAQKVQSGVPLSPTTASTVSKSSIVPSIKATAAPKKKQTRKIAHKDKHRTQHHKQHKQQAHSTQQVQEKQQKQHKRDGTCAPQVYPFNYQPTPNTPQAFLTDPYLLALSTTAKAPAGYSQNFTGQYGSLFAPNYINYYQLANYNVSTCGALCDSVPSCQGFNTYFERDPMLDPGQACPSPTAAVGVRCALWGVNVNAAQAQNIGEYRVDFMVVVAGSNGYNKNPVPATVTGYKAPVALAAAIDPSTIPSTAGVSYLGYSFLPNTFDPWVCAKYCAAQTAASKAASPTSYSACNYFNAFTVTYNNTAQGMYCQAFTGDASAYATAYTQVVNGVTYGLTYSYGYSATNPDLGPVSSSATSIAASATALVSSVVSGAGAAATSALASVGGIVSNAPSVAAGIASSAPAVVGSVVSSAAVAAGNSGAAATSVVPVIVSSAGAIAANAANAATSAAAGVLAGAGSLVGGLGATSSLMASAATTASSAAGGIIAGAGSLVSGAGSVATSAVGGLGAVSSSVAGTSSVATPIVGGILAGVASVIGGTGNVATSALGGLGAVSSSVPASSAAGGLLVGATSVVGGAGTIASSAAASVLGSAAASASVVSSAASPVATTVSKAISYAATTTISVNFGTASLVTTTMTPASAAGTVTVQVQYPTPAANCGNQGIAYAAYDSLTPSLSGVAAIFPENYKTKTPRYSGISSYIGLYAGSLSSTSPFYGQSTSPAQNIAMDHKFYVFANQPGTYTLTIPYADDIGFAWIGSKAVSGWTRANADVNQIGNSLSLSSYTVSWTMATGDYKPVRIFWANLVLGAELDVSVTAPDGSKFAVNTAGTNSGSIGPQIVQFPCNSASGSAFPAWGSES